MTIIPLTYVLGQLRRQLVARQSVGEIKMSDADHNNAMGFALPTISSPNGIDDVVVADNLDADTVSIISRESGGGYRDPPKPHRFQKGKSGNPNGRPRGSGKGASPADRLLQALEKVLGEQISYTKHGKRRRTASYEPLLEDLLRKAFNDRHARRDMLTLIASAADRVPKIDKKFLKRRLSNEDVEIIFDHPDVKRYQNSLLENSYKEAEQNYELLSPEQIIQYREILITLSGGRSEDEMALEKERRSYKYNGSFDANY